MMLGTRNSLQSRKVNVATLSKYTPQEIPNFKNRQIVPSTSNDLTFKQCRSQAMPNYPAKSFDPEKLGHSKLEGIMDSLKSIHELEANEKGIKHCRSISTPKKANVKFF